MPAKHIRKSLFYLGRVFWPIHRHELHKFLSMSALMFCVLMNQNILRILKDSILISEISAEVTSFAKVYCVTPAAALFVVVYAKMVASMSFERIYNSLLTFFVSFFAIFAFIIYPNVYNFHMAPDTMKLLMETYPHFKWYIALVGSWSYIILYVLSELWPNIFYVLLFWQFANEITTTSEAKRFYTLFSLFGNSSLIIVGIFGVRLANDIGQLRGYFGDIEDKVILVQVAVTVIILSAMISSALVHYVCRNIMTDPASYKAAKKERKKKPKLGVRESFKYIARSRYLWLMLVCSAAFGLTMNLVEAVWKAKIKELYPTVNAYAQFNSLYILWTGVAIMIMTIVGNNVMRHYSWFAAAIITPVVIMITGSIFFILVVFDHEVVSWFEGMILVTPLAMAVGVGAVQNVMAKGSKYSIWDTSREMLYIPLDDELKTRGKAAVDVISSKIGKSSSSLIQAVIFTIIPSATYTSIAPILMFVFVGVCMVWVYAVREINEEYLKIV